MTDPNLSEHIERVRAAQPSADAHEEAREAVARALADQSGYEWPDGLTPPDDRAYWIHLASVVIDAYLEALNAH